MQIDVRLIQPRRLGGERRGGGGAQCSPTTKRRREGCRKVLTRGRGKTRPFLYSGDVMDNTILYLMDIFMVVWMMAASVAMVTVTYVLIKILRDSMKEKG